MTAGSKDVKYNQLGAKQYYIHANISHTELDWAMETQYFVFQWRQYFPWDINYDNKQWRLQAKPKFQFISAV